MMTDPRCDAAKKRFGFVTIATRVTPSKDGVRLQPGEPVVVIGDDKWSQTTLPCPFCGEPMRRDDSMRRGGRIVAVVGEIDGFETGLYDPAPSDFFALACKPCRVGFWTTQEGYELAASNGQ